MDFFDDLRYCYGMATRNIPVLARYAREGFAILTAIPSCTLMFKQELPLMFPGDADVELVRAAMFDPFEYFVARHRDGLLKTDFTQPLGKVSYHVPCHGRVQKIGRKTEEMLKLIGKTVAVEVNTVERCAGHDGSYGVKTEFYANSMKIGRPVFRQMVEPEPDYISSDCPIAGRRIARAGYRQPLPGSGRPHRAAPVGESEMIRALIPALSLIALPLAALLRLTMLFPDRAPSRFKVARSAGQLRTGPERVRSVVARSHEQDHVRAVHPAESLAAGDRERRRCPLHQRALGDALHQRGFRRPDLRDPVGSSHDSATTNAVAIPASCDSDRCQVRIPCASASSATAPVSCSTGRPPSACTTSASRQRRPPGAPSALATASFAAKRAARLPDWLPSTASRMRMVPPRSRRT